MCSTKTVRRLLGAVLCVALLAALTMLARLGHLGVEQQTYSNMRPSQLLWHLGVQQQTYFELMVSMSILAAFAKIFHEIRSIGPRAEIQGEGRRWSGGPVMRTGGSDTYAKSFILSPVKSE